MALTTQRRDEAAKWFVRRYFKARKLVAIVHAGHIYTALDNIDDWYEAAPAGGATNKQALFLSIDSAVRALIPGGEQETVTALLNAAVSMARGGEFD